MSVGAKAPARHRWPVENNASTVPPQIDWVSVTHPHLGHLDAGAVLSPTDQPAGVHNGCKQVVSLAKGRVRLYHCCMPVRFVPSVD